MAGARGGTFVLPVRTSGDARRRAFGFALAAGLVVRLLLVPLHHPWDLQTFAGVWADQIHDRDPYTRMQELSLLTSSDRGTIFALDYEYFAYPPGLLYLEYPLAKAYGALDPGFDPELSAQNSVPIDPIPLGFMLLWKLPLFAADVGIALLLLRMAGVTAARRFFLNPYVILVSAAWTFESLPTLAAVGALYLARSKRWGWAGALLGMGALLKFLPGVLLPAFAIVAWREEGRAAALRVVGAFSLVLVPLSLPFLAGLEHVAGFHGSRLGGGLTVFQVLRLLPALRSGLLLEPQVAGSALGLVALVGAMVAAVGYLLVRPMSLERASILMLAAFLLGSKVVNEQFAFILLPFLLIELARWSDRRRELLYGLTWGIPLGFAAMNVPFVMFLVPLGMHVAPDVFAELARSPVALVTTSPLAEIRMIALTAVAFAFVATLVGVLRAYCRPDGRFHEDLLPVEAQPLPRRRPALVREGSA